MTDRTIWRDGQFIPWQDATVHVLSQSLQRGSLAFDYISVHATERGTAIFRLGDHIVRLLRTCSIMGLPLTFGASELEDAAVETVRRNPGARSLRISALIPSIELDLVPQDPTVSVFIAAYDFARDIAAHARGTPHIATELKLKVERAKRSRREELIPPQAKVAASYTPSMPAKWQARREGWDDIILLDEHDQVTELPTANLFAVTHAGGLLTAPGHKVLLGITRDSIMQLAAAMDIAVEERDFGVAELYAAAEVFCTGTSVGVWPVLQIDDVIYGNGRIGPVSERLQQRFRAVTRGEDPAFEHWLRYVD